MEIGMEQKVWLRLLVLDVLLASGCGSAGASTTTTRTPEADLPSSSASQLAEDKLATEAAGAALQVVDANGKPPAYGAFAAADGVYLTGTLPDGTYYYQITDRSCSRLLAGPAAAGDVPDTTYRRLEVQGGRLDPVSLAPFVTETPDGQAAYRVYVTPVSQYTFAGPGCYGFGAAPVTADFALEAGPATDPSYCVSGAVYVEQSPVDGVAVDLYLVGATVPVATSTTGLDGRYTICGLNGDHEYSLTVQAPEGTRSTDPADGRLPVTNYTREDLEVQPFYLL